MKLSTCSASKVARDGAVKNAATRRIKPKAQANYWQHRGAAQQPGSRRTGDVRR